MRAFVERETQFEKFDNIIMKLFEKYFQKIFFLQFVREVCGSAASSDACKIVTVEKSQDR